MNRVKFGQCSGQDEASGPFRSVWVGFSPYETFRSSFKLLYILLSLGNVWMGCCNCHVLILASV